MTFVEYLNKTIKEVNGIDTAPIEPQRVSPIVEGLKFGRYIVLSVEQDTVECRVSGIVKHYSLIELEERYSNWQIRQKEKREKEKLWKAISSEVKKRDRYKCTNCGATKSEALQLHAHHIKPRGAGGDDSLTNLTTLCIDCHAEEHKGTRRGEFLKKRAEALKIFS